jgi:hypothetical protein
MEFKKKEYGKAFQSLMLSRNSFLVAVFDNGPHWEDTTSNNASIIAFESVATETRLSSR